MEIKGRERNRGKYKGDCVNESVAGFGKRDRERWRKREGEGEGTEDRRVNIVAKGKEDNERGKRGRRMCRRK